MAYRTQDYLRLVQRDGNLAKADLKPGTYGPVYRELLSSGWITRNRSSKTANFYDLTPAGEQLIKLTASVPA